MPANINQETVDMSLGAYAKMNFSDKKFFLSKFFGCRPQRNVSFPGLVKSMVMCLALGAAAGVGAQTSTQMSTPTGTQFSLTPYIWLPTGYVYSAWWPWVKNYDGELRAGAVRPGPIYARLWIDQEQKQKMGFK